MRGRRMRVRRWRSGDTQVSPEGQYLCVTRGELPCVYRGKVRQRLRGLKGYWRGSGIVANIKELYI